MAQEPGRIYRLAVLSPGAIEVIGRVTLPELGKLGFVQGKNLVVTIRSSIPFDELPAAARDVVADRPDLVIAVSGLAVKALAAASHSIPILMSFADDPVGAGFVASLNRPGGKITGQTLDSDQQSPKRLELLHELVPSVRRFAVLSSGTGSNEHQASEVVARGRRLGLEVVVARAAQGYVNFSSASVVARAAAWVGLDTRTS
jgi:putative tryptophan/tyrosine transport system substrate-binding protein